MSLDNSKLFLKRFRGAWTSCLLFMVQGVIYYEEA